MPGTNGRGSIARSSVAFGDTARYEIESHQFSIEGPVSKRIDAGFDLVYETMSGATPWYVTPNPSGGAPQQAMSGATVSDTRIDGSVRGNYYFDRARTGAHFGVSGEKDYLAIYAGMNGEFHLNRANQQLGNSTRPSGTEAVTKCHSSPLLELTFRKIASFGKVGEGKTGIAGAWTMHLPTPTHGFRESRAHPLLEAGRGEPVACHQTV